MGIRIIKMEMILIFLMMIKEKGYIKEQLITFGKSMLKLGERDEIHNDIKKKECRTRDKR